MPIGALDGSTQLSISPHVRVERELSAIRRIHLGDRVISLRPDDGERVARLFDKLDGQRTLTEVAEDLEWSEEEAIDAAQDLYGYAVLNNVGDASVPPLLFFKHVAALGSSVQARLAGADSMIGSLMEGKPSRRLLMGHLIELYHVVDAASTHISPAINLAPNDRLRMLFCEYLADEYWHGRWLRKGLLAAGISEEELDRSDPLPGTLAVVHFLRIKSATDLLAYAACLSTAEAQGEGEVARVHRRYQMFDKDGLLGEDVIAPFRGHEIEDANSAHLSYCSEPFVEAAAIKRPHQDAIRSAVLLYLRTLDEQHRQVARFYGDPQGPACFRADLFD
ncbi:MAG TPA: hypothetical protein VK698_00970 [Kofleriaceae bacterium]|nr:hypothetical protein [Kofleriaceae bacterium]